MHLFPKTDCLGHETYTIVTTAAGPRPWVKHMSLQTFTTDVQAPVSRA